MQEGCRISIHIILVSALCIVSLVKEAPASDFSSLVGKHIVGYQGWFACPSDPIDPRWSHWFQGGHPPGPQTLSVDLWPDLSEFERDELCSTGMVLSSGAPAFVFSSEKDAAVRRHFRWMKDYRIDGAAVQRFLTDVSHPRSLARLNTILRNIRTAAEAEGRGFFVMYDVSGIESDQMIALIERDWKEIRKEQIISSSSYMRHRGKPVVGVWGLGFTDRKANAATAAALIRYFKVEENVTVLGGVPTHWRTLDGDSHREPEWAEVYRSFDIISPWTVGRFHDLQEADAFARDVMARDIRITQARGQEYMPVIFPGFSWHNLQHGAAPLDQIPRRCGAFYKAQATNAISLDATMLYTAMFDELDEGTAILKVTQSPAELPQGAALLILDAAETCRKQNDLYLQVAGKISDELHRKAEVK